MLIPCEDALISRFLNEYGEWADLELRFIAENVSDHSIVIDIGSFIGTFGVGLSHLRSLKSIYFFEANSEIIPALIENVNLNCKCNYYIYNKAVSPKDCALTTAWVELGNLGSFSFQPIDGAISIDTGIDNISIRHIIENNNPDLIKMDVEGMEYSILKEVEDSLSQYSGSFWLECRDGVQIFDALDLLIRSKYKVFYFAFPSHNPDNFKGKGKPIFPMAYEAGLFAARCAARMPNSLMKLGCLGKVINHREDLREALYRTPRWIPERWHDMLHPETISVALHELNASSSREGTLREAMGELETEKEQVSKLHAEASQRLADAESREGTFRETIGELETEKEQLSKLRAEASQRLADAETS